jgi:hypothetical protein
MLRDTLHLAAAPTLMSERNPIQTSATRPATSVMCHEQTKCTQQILLSAASPNRFFCRRACHRTGTARSDGWHLVGEPMLAADNNFRGLFLLIDDVHAGSALKNDAALPLHRIRRMTVVDTGERSLMRFRPARAKPSIVGQHRDVRDRRCGAEPS